MEQRAAGQRAVGTNEDMATGPHQILVYTFTLFLDRGSISCQCSFGPTKIFDIPVPLQLRKFAFVHATQRRRIVRSNICSLLMHKSKGTKHLFHFLPINVHNC